MERRTVLKEYYDKYWQETYELVYSLINEREKTQEIVAETFMILYRKISKDLDGDHNTRAFLLLTARKMALDYLKNLQHANSI